MMKAFIRFVQCWLSARAAWRKLRPQDRNHLNRLAERLAIRIQSPQLFIQALKHRSYLNISNEKHFHSYERLEFLGDAILSMIAGEYLFAKYPKEDEGFLTKGKSHLVNKKTLSQKAEAVGLGEFVFLSEGEERSGGRTRSSILADVFEAVIGAIYLDGGYARAREFVMGHILCNTEIILRDEMNSNYKGDLLEYTQGQEWGAPRYVVIAEEGPEHQKEFTVEVVIREQVYGSGRGLSKKEAEQQAASEALNKIRNKN